MRSETEHAEGHPGSRALLQAVLEQTTATAVQVRARMSGLESPLTQVSRNEQVEKKTLLGHQDRICVVQEGHSLSSRPG
jgi:hypothetical protein